MLQMMRCFRYALVFAPVILGFGSGCRTLSPHVADHALAESLLAQDMVPRELNKAVLSDYVIEPPDILVIEGIHLAPRPGYIMRTSDVISIRAQETVAQSPYRLRKGDVVGIDAFETIGDLLRPGDTVAVRVRGTPPIAPISGPTVIEPDGTINLDAIRFEVADPAGIQEPWGGMWYGSVSVAGQTPPEGAATIKKHLKQFIEDPVVSIFLLRKAPPRGISSAFVVESDGTVNLDSPLGVQPDLPAGRIGWNGRIRFGALTLAGFTRDEASEAIAKHIQDALPEPHVMVSVLRMARPQQISGAFQIEPEGIVNLDAPLNIQADPFAGTGQILPGEEPVLNVVTRYGAVPVAGWTKQEAEQKIAEHLQLLLPEPQVSVSILRMSGLQQIAGQHLVAPDGTVTLGTFGSVSVVGKTLAEAKRAIEHHLSYMLERPEVAVDVFAYNSMVYYVVYQGAGTGDTVYRLPITGNDTVLDAIAGIGGLQFVSSQNIWVARPTPHADQLLILPVDWAAVSSHGQAATNYQLMPGDRVFIAEDKWVALDTSLAKLMAPFERVMGFSILGVNTVSRFSGNVLQGGGLRGFFGGGGL